MHPNLVGAAGFQFDFQLGMLRKALLNSVVGNGGVGTVGWRGVGRRAGGGDDGGKTPQLTATWAMAASPV